MKIYRDKDCVEWFVDQIEDEVKRLHATFPQQAMAEVTDVLKREHIVTSAKNCHIFLKEFNYPENRKVRDLCHCTVL